MLIFIVVNIIMIIINDIILIVSLIWVSLGGWGKTASKIIVINIV